MIFPVHGEIILLFLYFSSCQSSPPSLFSFLSLSLSPSLLARFVQVPSIHHLREECWERRRRSAFSLSSLLRERERHNQTQWPEIWDHCPALKTGDFSFPLPLLRPFHLGIFFFQLPLLLLRLLGIWGMGFWVGGWGGISVCIEGRGQIFCL